VNAANLDMDVLRTLVTAETLGGFNRAAAQIGRSQSAVSQQLRKLEEQVGEPLFRKQGRRAALTDAGEILVRYARRILDLNDEALAAVRGAALEGLVRFGVPGDLAETWLPAALGRFKRAHPGTRVEVAVDRNLALLERLDQGELDLVLALGNGKRRDAWRVASLPMSWIGPASDEPVWADGDPVPLALVQSPCFFRKAGLDALDKAGIPWRVAFTSPSLSGLWAAVGAGLGVTVRTAAGLPPSLALLERRSGLPRLPSTELCLHDADRELSPPVARLREVVVETCRTSLGQRGFQIRQIREIRQKRRTL
jgi:DNA-binding transcriptional LysR family regulator